MLNPLEEAITGVPVSSGTVREVRGRRYLPPSPKPVVCGVLRLLDPLCVFFSALLAALAYIQWLPSVAATLRGADLERMALLAAVVAPFILYEQRFGSAASHGAVGLLVRSHLARFAVFTAAVLALGQLSYILVHIPRAVLALWFVLSLLLTSLTRVLLARYLRFLLRRGALTEVIAVVGAGPVADRLVLAMQQTRPESVALLGVFDDAAAGAGKVSVAGSIDDLLELGKTQRIDWVLLTAPPGSEDEVQSLVYRLKSLSVPIGLCPQHIGLAVPLRRLDCVADSLPVSILVDPPIDQFDRLRAAGEGLLPRWLITLAMLPLDGARESRDRLVAAGSRRRRERAAPLSLAIDDYNAVEFGRIAARFGQEKFGYVVTPNVDHMIRLHEDASFRALYARASFVLLDSQFLAHLVRLVRRLRLTVCPGSDVTGHLFSHVVAPDDRVVLVGGTPAQARQLTKRYGMRGLVHFNPPMGFIRDPRAVEECLEFIESHSPFRFCVLAVGSPQQEFVASELQRRGAARGLALCVGASIDFLTGVQHRAPKWMQRCGLEWSFRLMSSPGRMARRYLVRGPRVFALIRTAQLRLRSLPTLQAAATLRPVR